MTEPQKLYLHGNNGIIINEESEWFQQVLLANRDMWQPDKGETIEVIRSVDYTALQVELMQLQQKLLSLSIDHEHLKVPLGMARSGEWRTFEKHYFEDFPKVCSFCGGKERVQLHHIHPFHLKPELELVRDNVTPLCEGNPAINCHLVWGHLGSFKSFNETVVADVKFWAERFTKRPYETTNLHHTTCSATVHSNQ